MKIHIISNRDDYDDDDDGDDDSLHEDSAKKRSGAFSNPEKETSHQTHHLDCNHDGDGGGNHDGDCGGLPSPSSSP